MISSFSGCPVLDNGESQCLRCRGGADSDVSVAWLWRVALRSRFEMARRSRIGFPSALASMVRFSLVNVADTFGQATELVGVDVRIGKGDIEHSFHGAQRASTKASAELADRPG